MKKLLALSILLAVFASCGDADTYEDIENKSEVPDPGTDPVAMTYTKNVKPIIDANCIGCHRAGSSRALTTYAQVKASVESGALLARIQLQTGQQGIMPQAGRMAQTNIDVIVKWNADGLKEN
ncbi:cytochrome c [Flavobacterium gelatinilyticum]|uniref:cytochrome c n=1 Tax=Flavobacterium gelatinilyticum TaxID=3003260 RepID=UPI0024807E55|nr:cytochrome c [Flavobacterium gelatinilyticum]